MKLRALVQLKTGDAVSGVVTGRPWWFRYLRVRPTAVEKVQVFDGRTGQASPADGEIVVPKTSVNFLQKLVSTSTSEE